MTPDHEPPLLPPGPLTGPRLSSGITIAQLDAMIAVVDYGSFTAAADILGISQPSLSRRIRALEDVLGMAVFIASGRNMVLTELGRDLVPAGRRILAEIASIDSTIHAHRNLLAGTLKVAGLPSLISTVLPPYLGRFHHQFPEVRVETFTVEDSEELAEAVRLGRADLGFGVNETVPEQLAALPLKDQNFAAVLPEAATNGSADVLDVADLHGRTLVTLPEGTSIRAVTEGVYADYGVQPEQVITTTQRDALVQLSIAAGGITIVPEVLAHSASFLGGRVARLRTPARRSISVVYRDERHHGPALTNFLQLLRD